MPEEERLRLDVDVAASDALDDLAELQVGLESIDRQIQRTGKGHDKVRIDVETDISDAVTEMAALEAGMEALDDDVDIDVDSDIGPSADADVSDAVAEMAALEAGMEALDDDVLLDFEEEGIDDIPSLSGDGGGMIGPSTGAEVSDAVAAAAEGGAEAATSGGRDVDSFTIENIDEIEEVFGKHLDKGALARRGGDVARLEDMVEGDIDDLIDFDEAVDLARDPDTDIDIETLRRASGRKGPSKAADAIGELSEAGATALPGGNRRKRIAQEMDDLRLTIGGLHHAFAALLPIVGVYAGALPAVITAVGGLATAAIAATAALGAIAGLGLMGMSLQQEGEVSMDAITDDLSELTDSFIEAFDPLARSLAPTIEYAITQIETMAGPLANASGVLLQLRDNFKNVIDTITGGLPGFVQSMGTLAEASMPLLNDLMTFIADADILQFMVGVFADSLPALQMLGTALADLIPTLIQVSQGFLAVGAVVAKGLSIIGLLIDTIPFAGEVIGILAASFLALSAAIGFKAVMLRGATGAAIAYAKSIYATVIPAISAKIAAVTGLNATLATAVTLLGMLTGGLIIVGGIATLTSSKFDKLTGSIGGARKELERFSRTGNALGSTQFGSGGINGTDSQNVYQDNSQIIIEGGNKQDAARQQYAAEHERRQHIDTVFGG